MRRLLILVIVFSKVNGAVAQSLTQGDSSYRAQVAAFIHWYRTAYIGKDTINLQDSVITKSFPIQIYAYLDDTVNLTAAERAELLALTNAKPLVTWSTDLAGPVRIIATDSLEVLFSKNESHAWDQFHSQYGSGLYSFAAPIFLRHNTLCVFYAGYYCGILCGSGFTRLFRKNGEKWDFVQTYGGW